MRVDRLGAIRWNREAPEAWRRRPSKVGSVEVGTYGWLLRGVCQQGWGPCMASRAL